eukprot:GEMP01031760.1.p1 GENE.GEMP01031760.1~~GEMP01031760.1.p1  ORF type:complete len:139 (+),score=22.29 GEMP01031760.1:455-871(+)
MEGAPAKTLQEFDGPQRAGHTLGSRDDSPLTAMGSPKGTQWSKIHRQRSELDSRASGRTSQSRGQFTLGSTTKTRLTVDRQLSIPEAIREETDLSNSVYTRELAAPRSSKESVIGIGWGQKARTVEQDNVSIHVVPYE